LRGALEPNHASGIHVIRPPGLKLFAQIMTDRPAQCPHRRHQAEAGLRRRTPRTAHYSGP